LSDAALLDMLMVASVVLHEALLLGAVAVLLCGFDDLLIDAVYVGRRLWRAVFVYPRHARARADLMGSADPGWMAILVPAWDESAVIGQMLRGLTARLDYPRYRVFVGVYPNDPATRAAVDSVADARIERATVPNSGPSTKADCLNATWRALEAFERRAGIRFRAAVLHDAEDVVDPHELHVFDHLIPRLSLVQLPVLPLPDAASGWIAGHYIDEFSESHTKDLVVREAIGAAVPSAGVACAIDRELLGRIACGSSGAPFDAGCVTEDYEIGLKIARLGGRGALVRVASAVGTTRVATREFFPATLDAAVRQKSRWLLGIALMGWDRMGWSGGLANRLMLMRDRKSILTSFVTVAAYLLFILSLLFAGLCQLVPGAERLALPALAGDALAPLLLLNLGILFWRLVVRMAFVTRSYGWRQGLLSAPRAVVGNVINFLAAVSALRRYTAIVRGRAPLSWDKTAHRFPAAV
jgi:bacteriophage N4 adsorption protein B